MRKRGVGINRRPALRFASRGKRLAEATRNDGGTVDALRSLADPLEHLFEPRQLAFGLAQMRAQARQQLSIIFGSALGIWFSA
jgi:hypothetical protein